MIDRDKINQYIKICKSDKVSESDIYASVNYVIEKFKFAYDKMIETGTIDANLNSMMINILVDYLSMLIYT